jgi:hypothetical protein
LRIWGRAGRSFDELHDLFRVTGRAWMISELLWASATTVQMSWPG